MHLIQTLDAPRRVVAPQARVRAAPRPAVEARVVERGAATRVRRCTHQTVRGAPLREVLEDQAAAGSVRLGSRPALHGTAGFAHVSCLAEQAKILVAEAEENNLRGKVWDERFDRWSFCGLCEQKYHGLVFCALGWACWKTYVGRPEAERARRFAMSVLANGLYEGKHHEEALSVKEADLSTARRLGGSAHDMLVMQGNLASTYHHVGRHAEALRLRRDVYSGFLKLKGEEHSGTMREATNYAASLILLDRFEEAKSLTGRILPVAQRNYGDNDDKFIRIRALYAKARYRAHGATLDDVREAVTTLEDTERTARRVFGASHPTTTGHEESLRDARAALAARDVEALGDALGALGAA